MLLCPPAVHVTNTRAVLFILHLVSAYTGVFIHVCLRVPSLVDTSGDVIHDVGQYNLRLKLQLVCVCLPAQVMKITCYFSRKIKLNNKK